MHPIDGLMFRDGSRCQRKGRDDGRKGFWNGDEVTLTGRDLSEHDKGENRDETGYVGRIYLPESTSCIFRKVLSAHRALENAEAA